jgi:3',5'-cyclic AMP phosphodiesterase CpdA
MSTTATARAAWVMTARPASRRAGDRGALRADVVLLAGDTFENNQLSAAILDGAGRLLAEAGMPIVILPGNHDPALPNSVYVRGGFAGSRMSHSRRHR